MTAQARLLGGRYQVGELLGYGGMAEVHRGRDLRLGRDVAIKMLRTDLARDATFQMRFRREAQNAASLNHPAIVAVYDTGEEIAPTGETLPFIVMEFVNGRTLKEVLAAEGRLMPRRALEITADICAALEFSHRHGIIHRDIKPGNVMLTLTGQVKVMDFGIARALASGATTMTQTSAVIGTAQYLSPEQARGEAVDARSDVYAAGCVIFELLCGHPPFVGDSPVSVAYQHVREDPPTPSDINPDVTPAIDSIVLKALSKNPLNRYQSAAEMRADLLRAAAGRPVMATPVLRQDETVAMPQNIARGGMPAGGGMGAGTRPMPSRPGDSRRRRGSAWLLATLSGLGVLAVVALVAALLSQQNQKPDDIAVPDVQGRSQADAIAQLQQANLLPSPSPTFNNDCVKDQVISQNPIGGAAVAPRAQVAIVVCGGKPSVKIPTDLVGKDLQYVTGTLEGQGFKVKPVAQESSKKENTVLDVSPDEGQTVDAGSQVTVTYSKGNLKTVPYVVGKSEADAKREIERAGFKVDVEPQRGSADSDGEVVDQDPGQGVKLPAGSTVTIVVIEGQDDPSPDPSATTGQPGTGAGGLFPGLGGSGGGAAVPTPTPSSRH
ncbi:Stk1 family PASTA domain-containing Ser/Thr kinase [Micromonospora sp. NPDC049559]|uniref:Stk1 family PASTA domain-containing Ser/Thr kinase n=1 Tax=Micromonospora sp. NPDC049559 TaxID=3155923 RepID=UPI0034412DD1